MKLHLELETAVREFVLEVFLTGEDGSEITAETDLVKGGIVDSLNVLRLVGFMEETYDIVLEPEDLYKLTSIANIVSVIREKQES